MKTALSSTMTALALIAGFTAAAQAEAPRQISVVQEEFDFDVDTSTAKVEILTDRRKPYYRVGETFDIQVRSSVDAYITVFNVSPKGDVAVLFPNKFNDDNFAKAGERIDVPGEGASLKVGLPVGADLIKVVATKDPLPLPNLSEVAGGFRIGDSKAAAQVARSLSVTADEDDKPSKRGVLGETSLVIQTYEDGAEIDDDFGMDLEEKGLRFVLGVDRLAYAPGGRVTVRMAASERCDATLVALDDDGGVRHVTAENLVTLRPNRERRIRSMYRAGSKPGYETLIGVCAKGDGPIVIDLDQLKELRPVLRERLASAASDNRSLMSFDDGRDLMVVVKTPKTVQSVQAAVSYLIRD